MGFLQKLWNYNVIRLIVITLVVVLLIRFVLPYLGPFVIALLIVMPLHPIFAKIQEKLHIPKGFTAGFFLLILFVIAALALWFFAGKCIDFMGFCSKNADHMCKGVNDMISYCCRLFAGSTGMSGVRVETVVIDTAGHLIGAARERIFPKIMDVSTTYINFVIGGMAYLTFTVIAVILLAKDYGEIRERIQQNAMYLRAREIAGKILKLLKIYLRAQGIIILCVSLLSVTGLFACGVEGALGFGLLAGFLDVLPLIGTGVVFVPIAIGQLFSGHVIRALGCVAVYVVCALVRQTLEPKLIGEKINIYPVFLLLSVFFGIQIFGVLGIFCGPLSLFLVKELYAELRRTK